MSTVIANKLSTRFSDYIDFGNVHNFSNSYLSWNMDGTQGILDNNSLNVSSIVDAGVGITNIGFTNSFNTTKYIFAGFARHSGDTAELRICMNSSSTKTVSELTIHTSNAGTTEVDSPHLSIIVIGDI